MKVPFITRRRRPFVGWPARSEEKRRWFQRVLGLRKEFEFENESPSAKDNVTIALFKGKPSPQTFDHMSFHLPTMSILAKALAHLKKPRSKSKIRTTRIGPKRRFSARGALVSRSRWLPLGTQRAGRPLSRRSSSRWVASEWEDPVISCRSREENRSATQPKLRFVFTELNLSGC